MCPPEAQPPDSPQYDPAQLAFLRAAGYDLSSLGRPGAPEAEETATEAAAEPAAVIEIPKSRLAINALFTEEDITLSSGENTRSLPWAGWYNSRDRLITAEQASTGKVRHLGTWAILNQPGTAFSLIDLRAWMKAEGVSQDRYLQVTAAVRTWWEHTLRLMGHGLIVPVSTTTPWRVQANPRMDITAKRAKITDNE